jgi:hypothetical protein
VVTLISMVNYTKMVELLVGGQCWKTLVEIYGGRIYGYFFEGKPHRMQND